jgi:hypothetical protein
MANIFHRIKAIFIPNVSTEVSDDLYVKVVSERTLDTAETGDWAVKRGKAPAAAETVKINVKSFLKKMDFPLNKSRTVTFNKMLNVS